MPVGRSVSEVLRLVQAFQFTDECGEVRREEREGRSLYLPRGLSGKLEAWRRDYKAKRQRSSAIFRQDGR